MTGRVHWVDLTSGREEALPEGGDLIERLKRGGVGRGRAGSPDVVRQLEDSVGVDLLVVHLLDGGRRTQLRRRWAMRHREAFVSGVRALAGHVGPRRVVVVADRRWRQVMAALKEGQVEAKLMRVRDVYPQQDPPALLWSVDRRRLSAGACPTRVRAIVVDGITATEVGEVALGRRVTARPVVCWDHRVEDVQFAIADAGTAAAEVLRRVDVPPPGGGEVVADDVLRQERRAIEGLTINGSLATMHLLPEVAAAPAEACVRCGWCLDVCPTHLNPVALLEAGQAGDRRLAERFHVGGCIECGLCDAACPSRLPILTGIRVAKSLKGGPT